MRRITMIEHNEANPGKVIPLRTVEEQAVAFEAQHNNEIKNTGLIGSIKEHRDINPKEQKLKGMTLAKRIRYMRDQDRVLVTGKFRFLELQGGTLRFSFRKYKGDPIERYELEDGKIYTIPYGVAKHLCHNVWYPVHKYLLGSDGKPSKCVGYKVHRCTFDSLEFKEINDLGERQIDEVISVKNLT